MSELFERYREKLPALSILAVLLLGLIVGFVFGLELALLTLAGAGLLGAILLFWNSLQALSGEAALSLDDALGMAAPPTEEEQKRSVLRALKDVEYERSVGKISEEDYAELATHYRQEAKRLILRLDETTQLARDEAEKLVAERLSKGQTKTGKKRSSKSQSDDESAHDQPASPADDSDDEVEPVDSEDSQRSEAEAKTVQKTAVPAGASSGPRRRCAECGELSPLDADSCKHCGHTHARQGERLCSACPAVYDKNLDACPQCGVASVAGVAAETNS